MKKIILAVIVLIVLGGIGVYSQKNLIRKDPILNPNPKDTDQPFVPVVSNPNGDYQDYSPLNKESDITVLASYVIKNTDSLPITKKLDGDTITIKSISVNKKTDGFSVYLDVLYKGAENKIGFWYRNPNPMETGVGCNNNCGGGSSVQIRQWTEKPTLDEKNMGIEENIFIKLIALKNFEYDFKTDRWNGITISSLLYKEGSTRNITN